MIESEEENLEEIVTASSGELTEFENKLRPRRLEDYIGQKNIKSNLSISIEASMVLPGLGRRP